MEKNLLERWGVDGWTGVQCTQRHCAFYCGSKLRGNTQKLTAAQHKAHCDGGAAGEYKIMLQIYVNTRAGAAGKVNRAEKFLWPV